MEPAKTPRVETILARAALLATLRGHDYLGTEHLMLAILDDEGGMASAAITELGVDGQIRQRIMAIMNSDSYSQTSPGSESDGGIA